MSPYNWAWIFKLRSVLFIFGPSCSECSLSYILSIIHCIFLVLEKEILTVVTFSSFDTGNISVISQNISQVHITCFNFIRKRIHFALPRAFEASTYKHSSYRVSSSNPVRKPRFCMSYSRGRGRKKAWGPGRSLITVLYFQSHYY